MYALRWFSQAFAFSLILTVFSFMIFGGFVGAIASALSFALTKSLTLLGPFFGACAGMSIGMLGIASLVPDDADC